jgi:membrane dipeptidase
LRIAERTTGAWHRISRDGRNVDNTRVITWDAHACLPLHPHADLEPLERFRAAGVNYVSINVGMDLNPVPQVLAVIAGFRQRLAAEPERFVLANRVADIEAAAAAGRLAVGFDLEGALPLQELPEMVALYRDLGVRQIHLAYNRNNSVADGCHDAERGLTTLGRRVVAAINGAGVLMDCSHTGRRCSLDIMAASTAPVIFSHSNPAALVDHGRNVTDEQIRTCAATGGVVCVSGVSIFVGAGAPSARDVARHAAYIASLVGVEHAGIGLDIGFSQDGLPDWGDGPIDTDYWWPRSAGYQDALARIAYPPVEAWRQLTGELQGAGMTADEAALVMGGNMARVARIAWRG